MPIDLHPSEEDVVEPDREYPIIDDFYIEEDVDSIDTQVESDTGAVITTETSESDLQFETTSDIAGEEQTLVAVQSMKYYVIKGSELC